MVFAARGQTRLRVNKQGEETTDLLTVVVTGLMIVHPSGEVNAIRAHEHKLAVELDGKTYEVKQSLSFEGFDSSAKRLTGTLPPDLSQLFSTSSPRLSVDYGKVVTFRIPGGRTSLGGKTQSCTVNGVPTVFSLGVVWEGRSATTSSMVIDGKRHSLTGITSVSISNEYQGTGMVDHLPMYGSFLKGADLKYNAPVCAVKVIKANPLFCPPVSLQ